MRALAQPALARWGPAPATPAAPRRTYRPGRVWRSPRPSGRALPPPLPPPRSLRDSVESPPAPEAATPEPPSERALRLWRTAQAVCFDVDCTLALNDQLDLLAEFMGVGAEVAAVTSGAMDGSVSLEAAIEERLCLINCTPSDIRAFLEAHPAETRLSPGAKQLVQALQARGTAVYLISGGFRELCLPIADALGVPRSNLFANRMQWQWDDDTGMPTRLVGFDLDEPTGKQRGKALAIAKLRHKYPYEVVVMVGDGITDLEAVQESGGADMFVGYGGVVRRKAVEAAADWFVSSFDELYAALQRYRVAMVGSGAWACAAVRMVAENCAARDVGDRFVDEVRMWVHEELLPDRTPLSAAINATHENPLYLPGVPLGDNVRACPSLEASGASRGRRAI